MFSSLRSFRLLWPSDPTKTGFLLQWGFFYFLVAILFITCSTRTIEHISYALNGFFAHVIITKKERDILGER
jgi:hypothetical protein